MDKDFSKIFINFDNNVFILIVFCFFFVNSKWKSRLIHKSMTKLVNQMKYGVPQGSHLVPLICLFCAVSRTVAHTDFFGYQIYMNYDIHTNIRIIVRTITAKE